MWLIYKVKYVAILDTVVFGGRILVCNEKEFIRSKQLLVSVSELRCMVFVCCFMCGVTLCVIYITIPYHSQFRTTGWHLCITFSNYRVKASFKRALILSYLPWFSWLPRNKRRKGRLPQVSPWLVTSTSFPANSFVILQFEANTDCATDSN